MNTVYGKSAIEGVPKLTLELIIECYPVWLQTEFELFSQMSLRFFNGGEGNPEGFFRKTATRETGGLIQTKGGFRQDCQSRYSLFTDIIPDEMTFEKYCDGVLKGDIKLGSLTNFHDFVEKQRRSDQLRKQQEEKKKKQMQKKKTPQKKGKNSKKEKKEDDEEDDEEKSDSDEEVYAGSLKPPPPKRESATDKIKKEFKYIRQTMESKLLGTHDKPLTQTVAAKVLPQLWKMDVLKITPKVRELERIYIPHRLKQLKDRNAQLKSPEKAKNKKKPDEQDVSVPKPVSDIFTEWLKDFPNQFPDPEEGLTEKDLLPEPEEDDVEAVSNPRIDYATARLSKHVSRTFQGPTLFFENRS